MTRGRELITALRATLALTLLCGLLYPLAITGVSQVAFPGNADGQLIYVHGRLVGSKLIGQQFAQPAGAGATGGAPARAGTGAVPDRRYFQTRPSATTPPDNAAATTFSNLGPNDLATKRAIQADVGAYIKLNGRYDPGGLTAAKVPVDAADSSASGIDPDISVANARIQARRVAAVRRIPLARVDRLISTHTAGRGLGFAGEPAVNVLELNLALNGER